MDIETLIHDPAIAKDITVNVNGADLLNFARKLVQSNSKELKASMEQGNKPNKLLTRKEVAEIFGVNQSTLWRWQKRGILIPIKIGGKVRYRRSDIENELINNK